MRLKWKWSNIGTVVLVCTTLVCGLSSGCRKETPAPSNSAPEPIPTDRVGGGTGIGGGTVAGGSNPIKPDTSTTSMTLEQLLASLPKDKLPKPGADGADAREGAKEWLSQNVVGKTAEAAFRIDELKKPSVEDKFNITPISMVGTDNPQSRRPMLGIPVGETRVGPHQCILQIFGPEPTWPGVPATQLPKFETLVGQVVRVRGKVEAVHIDQGENEQQLVFSVTLAEMRPDFDAKSTDPVKPGSSTGTTTTTTAAARADFQERMAKVVKEMPKPVLASDLPALAGSATYDRLVPEDKYLPYRRVIGTLVDGQLHGEVRAYGPKRRLMLSETYEHGKRHGIQRMFYPSGKQFGLTTYVNGNVDGLAFNWYGHGPLESFMTWKNGMQDGLGAKFHENSKVWQLAEMKDGKFEGVRFHFLPSGELQGTSTWQNGKEVHQEVLRKDLTEFEEHSLKAFASRKTELKAYWTNSQQELPGPVEGRRKVGEWYSLFNGKDVTGWWPQITPDGTPEKWSQWEVKDGILIGTGKGTDKGRITHLISDDDFLNFHLKAEVRIDDASNSGICFGFPYVHAAPLGGYEAQIAMKDKAAVTGGLFHHTRAKQRQPNPLHHQAGEWFTMEIIVRDGRVVVKVNGNTTAEEKLEPYSGLHEVMRGHIGLQVHGKASRVEFRKVDIMPLPD